MPYLSSVLQGKRVVIVEDEGMTQIQLNRVFTASGMKVVGQAISAEAGIEIILREKPDLVTMDITLGKMNGIEATQRIMDEFPTCIIVMTAYKATDYQQPAQEAGASGYIIKPFTARTVLPRIEAFYQQWIAALPRRQIDPLLTKFPASSSDEGDG